VCKPLKLKQSCRFNTERSGKVRVALQAYTLHWVSVISSFSLLKGQIGSFHEEKIRCDLPTVVFNQTSISNLINGFHTQETAVLWRLPQLLCMFII